MTDRDKCPLCGKVRNPMPSDYQLPEHRWLEWGLEGRHRCTRCGAFQDENPGSACSGVKPAISSDELLAKARAVNAERISAIEASLVALVDSGVALADLEIVSEPMLGRTRVRERDDPLKCARTLALERMLDESRAKLGATERRLGSYRSGIGRALRGRELRPTGEPARSDAAEILAMRRRLAEAEAELRDLRGLADLRDGLRDALGPPKRGRRAV